MIERRLETIEDWRRNAEGLTRAQFLAAYPYPFLLRQKLRRTLAAVKPAEPPTDDDWVEPVGFETVVRAGMPPPTTMGPRLRGARVTPVVKVPGAPFPDQISVGRALNCDLVLRDPSVSKLHAYFKSVGPDGAELVDARSANGTRVNGEKIAPLTATRIVGGDGILFGEVAVQFLDAGRLYDLL